MPERLNGRKISQKLRECMVVREPICNCGRARTADIVLVKAAGISEYDACEAVAMRHES